MIARQITVDEAREFFAHPSQWKSGKPDELPEAGTVYYASGHICGAFHDIPWPGVICAHCGVKPEGWGRLVPHAKAILRQVWDDYKPELIVAWTDSSNRATLAFNRRCGFEVHGTMPAKGGVVMQHWRP